MSIEHRVRPEVRGMVRPRHGGDVWQYNGIHDYSSNVNPLGPPPRLQEYIAEAAEGLLNYPDDSAEGLKAAIASHYGVGKESIIVGAGSAELIRLFPEVFIDRGDKVLMPRPTFSEYSFACRLMGAQLIDLPLPEEDGFRMDLDAAIKSVDARTKAVYLCNPNNPTSRLVAKKAVMELVRECSRTGTLVFLDETLLDFCEDAQEHSCVQEVEGNPNLFIIRSFTKSFAVPGMRIGYGFGSPELIRFMDAGRLTWNVGTIEQRVATRLMENDYEHVRQAVRLLSAEKRRMHRGISSVLRTPLPDSYFFFADVSPLGVDSGQFRSAMLRHNVLVRDCSSFGPPCHKYSRFCVKTKDKDDEFLDAFRCAVEDIASGRN